MATDYVKEYADALMPFIAKKFGLGPMGQVLDIGCGDGEYIEALGKIGILAVGIDKRGGWSIPAGDAEHLSYPDACFRVTFSKSVLEHLHDPDAAVAEMFRVLTPGGMSINLVPDWWYCYRSFYSAHDHIRPFCAAGLKDMMEVAGFEDVKVERFIPSIVLLRHPKWRWLLTAVAYVFPYRWLGKLRFAAPRHWMILASGKKPDGV